MYWAKFNRLPSFQFILHAFFISTNENAPPMRGGSTRKWRGATNSTTQENQEGKQHHQKRVTIANVGYNDNAKAQRKTPATGHIIPKIEKQQQPKKQRHQSQGVWASRFLRPFELCSSQDDPEANQRNSATQKNEGEAEREHHPTGLPLHKSETKPKDPSNETQNTNNRRNDNPTTNDTRGSVFGLPFLHLPQWLVSRTTQRPIHETATTW